MLASDPSKRIEARRGASRARTSFWLLIAGMIAAIVAAGMAMRRAADLLLTSADPRFPAHYSAGAVMPFPVIMDHEHGWAFLGIFWTLVAILAVLSLAASAALGRAGKRAPSMLVAGLVAVVALMTLLPVTFSLDAYAYAAFGRLLGVDHANPYVQHLAGGSPFPDPVLARLTSLLGTPLPDENYGPLWTLIAGGIAAIARDGGVAAAVWGQRAAGAIALIAASLGALRLTRSAGPAEGSRRAALFALHPAALYESAAAGHNDMLMIAPAIWSFALADEMPIAAGMLAGAAIAVKYVACLAVPFLVIRAYRAKGIGAAVWVAALSLVVPAVLFAPLWPGMSALAPLLHLRENLVMSGLWLAGMWLPAAFVPIASTVVTLAAAAIVVVSIVRYARDRKGVHVSRSIAAVLWASPLLNPWYVQWLLPAAAGIGAWARYAWWFALVVTLRYVEDALRYPSSPADMSARVALLESVTVAMLVAPILLSALPRLPFQRDGAGDA